MNESREAFEDWISAPPFERDPKRWPDKADAAWPGSYKELDIDLAWLAWQASREGTLANQIAELVSGSKATRDYVLTAEKPGADLILNRKRYEAWITRGIEHLISTNTL